MLHALLPAFSEHCLWLCTRVFVLPASQNYSPITVSRLSATNRQRSKNEGSGGESNHQPRLDLCATGSSTHMLPPIAETGTKKENPGRAFTLDRVLCWKDRQFRPSRADSENLEHVPT